MTVTTAELTDLENEGRFSPTSGNTDTGREQDAFDLGFDPALETEDVSEGDPWGEFGTMELLAA